MYINEFSGAGVILLEYYRKKDNTYELVVILIHNKHKLLYECPGGRLDKHDNVFKAAARELREETANMFNLPTNILTMDESVNIKSGRRLYKTFIINIIPPDATKNKLNLNIFFNNKNILKDKNIPHYWDETDIITRLSISQFVKDINNKTEEKHIKTTDVYGKNIIFSRRDSECLALALSKNFIILLNQLYVSNVLLYKLKYNNNYINDKYKFLNNTKCYY